MQDDVSPEQRLLRLIRGREPKAPIKKDRDEAEDTAVARQAQPVARAAAMPADFGFSKLKRRLSLKLLQRILRMVLLASLIYLGADFFINTAGKIEEQIILLNEDAGTSAAFSPQTPAVTPPRPVSYFKAAVETKNIFTAKVEGEKEAPSLTFIEMVSRLRLQGVISGANPQAIIEDTKTKRVHFLGPGEYIGEIRVKEILSGRVILEFYGQEADLRL